MPNVNDLIALLSTQEKRQLGTKIARYYPEWRPYYQGEKPIVSESPKRQRLYNEKVKEVVTEVMLDGASSVVGDIELLQKVQWAIALSAYGEFQHASKLLENIEVKALEQEKYDMLSYLHQLKYSLFDDRYAQQDLPLPKTNYDDRHEWINKNNSLLEQLCYHEFQIRQLIHKYYRDPNMITVFEWPEVLANPIPRWASRFAKMTYHLARGTYYFYYRQLDKSRDEINTALQVVANTPNLSRNHPKYLEYLQQMQTRIHIHFEDKEGMQSVIQAHYKQIDTPMPMERKLNLRASLYILELIYYDINKTFCNPDFQVSQVRVLIHEHSDKIKRVYRQLLLLNAAEFDYKSKRHVDSLKLLGILLRDSRKQLRTDLFYFALYMRLLNLHALNDSTETKYAAKYMKRNLKKDDRYNSLDEAILKPMALGKDPNISPFEFEHTMLALGIENEYAYQCLLLWLKELPANRQSKP